MRWLNAIVAAVFAHAQETTVAAIFPDGPQCYFDTSTTTTTATMRLFAVFNVFYQAGILAGPLAGGGLHGSRLPPHRGWSCSLFVLQIARDHFATKLTWAALVAIGLLSAAALHALARNGHLQPVADRQVVGTGQ